MHPFFCLREQLPMLAFDPSADIPVSRQAFLADYLACYQLDFPQDISRYHAVGRFAAGAYEIVCHYWLPALSQPKGTIFVLHGYYDHVGLFHHVIRFLLEQGYVVVAYDLPGHGLSSGERACIGDFSEYVTVLRECLDRSVLLPKPWHSLGQSTGGAILLHALLIGKNPDPFQRVVLLAPLIKPAGWNVGVWSYRLLKPFIKQIKRQFSNNSNDACFVNFCREHDPLQPKYLSMRWVGAMKKWMECFPSLDPITAKILVIQGEADGTVDWRFNMELLRRKLSDAEFFQLAGARHQLVNEAASIRQQIFTRIEKFLLASG